MNGPRRRNVLGRVRPLLLLLLPLCAAGPAGAEGEVRLLTDDAIPRYLSRGQELAKAQQWDKVVDILHRVVIGDPEVFPDVKDDVLRSAVYSEDGRTFYPARELCLRELARLPPDGLRAYRDAHDAEARRLFEAAEATPGIEDRLVAYAKVHDSFLPSSVGDDALEKAGDLNLQLGRFYEALSLYRRLVDLYPKDTDRDVPLVLAKASYCAARIGDAEQLTALLDRLTSEYADATVTVEGKPVPVSGIKELPIFKRGGGPPSRGTDWPMAGGNLARSRAAADLPEDLPRLPFWSFPLAERDTRLAAEGKEWSVFVHDRQPSPDPVIPSDVNVRTYLAPYPTIFPIVHDGLLLYKDGRDVVARRAGSGVLVHLIQPAEQPRTLSDARDPSYRCPLDEIRPGTQDAVKDSGVIEAIYEYFDYGAASLFVSRGRIFTIDWRGAPQELRGEAPLIRNQPNSLVCYTRADGKAMWGWDELSYSVAVRSNPAVFEGWQRDLQLHRTASFLGPGLGSGGLVYTLAAERESDEPGTVSLWAFDAATGLVRFRTVLHYDDEVARHLPRGAALALAGGTVFAATQAGVVAAVDALPPGQVKWITRYDRDFEGVQGGRRGFRAGHIKQTFAFGDPVVAEGKVVVAPADADEVLALDTETGRVVWTIPKQAVSLAAYIVGAKDGVLYLGGDKVYAIDLAKGEILWQTPLDASCFGRGFVGERYLHIPTQLRNANRSEVERFDLRTGKPASPIPFDVKNLGNLLSFDGRLVAANGREIMCFTTYEAEVARVDAALNRAGADRVELLLERGLLALAGATKRRDQAREDFAKALEAGGEAKNAPVRRYAIQNLFEIARDKNDLGALDEASKVVAPLRDPGQGGDGSMNAYDAQIAYLRAEVLGHLGKGEEALTALEAFVDRYGHMRVVRDGRVVAGTAAGAALRDQLRSESAAFATAFAATVRGRIDAAVTARDIDGLKEILARYGDEPPAEEARFALADLYEQAGRTGDAEAELRGFAHDHPQHPRLAEAHLRLARLYARAGKTDAARRERFDAVSLLDDAQRSENAAIIAEIDAKLAAAEPPTPAPPLRLPLVASSVPLEGAAPVEVAGGLPEGLALFATPQEFLAVEPGGKVRWRADNPSHTGISPGPDGEPSTATVAAMVAAARFAVRRGDDVILGDVSGLMRINATTGEVHWRYPAKETQAREQGQAAIDLLRKDLRDAAATGFALRDHPLPSYLLTDWVIVRVDPTAGVEGIHPSTGTWVWNVPDTAGHVAVGPPVSFGDTVVVGFAKPGQVRIFQAADSAMIAVLDRTVLLAPPVVDPLGRLFVTSSAEAAGANGQVEMLDLRSPETRRRFPVATGNAAVLYADGKTLVYHDGAVGTENLHFVDLAGGKETAVRGPDLLRAYERIEGAPGVFVLTHNPGLEDEGARLFRIDPKAAEVLEYDFREKAAAFARPVLTEHHIAVASVLARGAHLRLFDRQASSASRGAQPLFVDPTGKETAEMDLFASSAARFSAGIGVATAGEGLVVGHPWGVSRFSAPPEKKGD
jgi:outer membrane protein assembly factor BamB/tetratricopeptide (TPR) repeat protein